MIEAEIFFIKCLNGKMELLGDEHLDTLEVMNSLADVYIYNTKWRHFDITLQQLNEIEYLLKHILNKYQIIYTNNNIITINIIIKLINYYINIIQLNYLAKELLEILIIYLYNKNHLNSIILAENCYNLANILQNEHYFNIYYSTEMFLFSFLCYYYIYSKQSYHLTLNYNEIIKLKPIFKSPLNYNNENLNVNINENIHKNYSNKNYLPNEILSKQSPQKTHKTGLLHEIITKNSNQENQLNNLNQLNQSNNNKTNEMTNDEIIKQLYIHTPPYIVLNTTHGYLSKYDNYYIKKDNSNLIANTANKRNRIWISCLNEAKSVVNILNKSISSVTIGAGKSFLPEKSMSMFRVTDTTILKSNYLNTTINIQSNINNHTITNINNNFHFQTINNNNSVNLPLKLALKSNLDINCDYIQESWNILWINWINLIDIKHSDYTIQQIEMLSDIKSLYLGIASRCNYKD